MAVYTLYCKDTFQYNHDYNSHFIYTFLDIFLMKETKDDRAVDLHLSFPNHAVALEILPAAFHGQIMLAGS